MKSSPPQRSRPSMKAFQSPVMPLGTGRRAPRPPRLPACDQYGKHSERRSCRWSRVAGSGWCCGLHGRTYPGGSVDSAGCQPARWARVAARRWDLQHTVPAARFWVGPRPCPHSAGRLRCPCSAEPGAQHTWASSTSPCSTHCPSPA
jgi:hypothetical protein